MTNLGRAIVAALALYVIWTIATWFLEGRIETLLHPDAVAGRLIYAVVANLVIGLGGAIVLLRFILNWTGRTTSDAGFGSPCRTALAVPAGLFLGFSFYALAGGPTTDPIVLTNAFAQVLVVSAAEVIVCWVLVGSVTVTVFRNSGRWLAPAIAAIVASALFGVYHYAHSAPFNTLAWVVFLSAIGLMTGLFFFVSRDVYGTIAFHNFLGVLGVVNTLAAKDQLQPMMQLQVPLLAMAMIGLIALVGLDRAVLRRQARAP